MALHGTHRGSTMPLLAGREPAHRPIKWRFIHLWRVEADRIVERRACRDDLALPAQLDPVT